MNDFLNLLSTVSLVYSKDDINFSGLSIKYFKFNNIKLSKTEVFSVILKFYMKPES